MADKLNSTFFSPGIVPNDPAQLPQYLRDLTVQLNGAIQSLDKGGYDKTYVAPTKPREGDMAYADGSYWNPGSGEGMYRYNGSAWVAMTPSSVAYATTAGTANALNASNNYTVYTLSATALTTSQQLFFGYGGAGGYINSADGYWGMVYRPSVNGSGGYSHLWTNNVGSGLMTLSTSGTLGANQFSGGGAGLTGTASGLTAGLANGVNSYPNRTDAAWYQAVWSNKGGNGDTNIYSTNNVQILSSGNGGVRFGGQWSISGDPSWGLYSSAGLITVGSIAVPRMYDSEDTSFYCDPNGWSLLNSIRLRDNTGYYLFGSYSDPSIRVGNVKADDLTSYGNISTNSVFAQLFYDSNNTGYYINPYGTSRTGAIIADSPGGSTGACMVNQDNRIGRWIVGSGYFEVLIDGSAYGVSFFASDEKIKKNIVPTTYNALDTIDQFKFKEFDYDPTKSVHLGHVKCGVIAQQIQSVDDNLVEQKGDFLAPKLDQMVYLSQKAIQELHEKVKSQQAQIDALIAKVGI